MLYLFHCASISRGCIHTSSLNAFYVVYANETEKSNIIFGAAQVRGGVQVSGVAVLPDSRLGG